MRKYKGEGKYRTVTSQYYKWRKKINKMKAASRRKNSRRK